MSQVPDNKETLELIGGRNGIIQQLDSACIMPNGGPRQFVESIFHFHKKNSRLGAVKRARGRGGKWSDFMDVVC